MPRVDKMELFYEHPPDLNFLDHPSHIRSQAYLLQLHALQGRRMW